MLIVIVELVELSEPRVHIISEVRWARLWDRAGWFRASVSSVTAGL